MLLLFCAVATGLETIFGSSRGTIDWPDRAGWRRVGAILGATLAYIILLPYLGHALTTTGVAMVVLHVMGMTGWMVKVGESLLFGVGSYLLFARVLGIPLPLGVLFR